ncbi:unnamed protein product, partial [Symbiodinium microadriaticum]
EKEIEKRKLLERKKEMQLSLEAQVQLKSDLERERKERRRQSVALNKRILQEAKQKEEEMLRKKKEEEQSLLLAHREDFLALREREMEEEEERRRSLALRLEEQKKQKETEEELKKAQKDEEADLLATRKEMWEDKVQFAEEQRMRRRESLAGRLDQWREAKKREEEVLKQQKDEEIAELKEKRQVWMDFNDLKRECSERDRQSILWRLDKWRDERDLEEEEKRKQQEIENTERELMIAEWEDVMQFKEEQECLRRQSLAFRLDAAARERDFMQGQEANWQAVQKIENSWHQSDREAVMSYQAALEEERRQSLAFRLQRKHREYDEGMKLEEQQRRQEELHTRADDWRCVQQKLVEDRVRERRELAERIEEAKRNKEKDLLRHREQLDLMHADLESRREDWKAVEEARKKEKERSRKSICLRLQSWRKNKLRLDRERTQQRLQEEEEAMYRRQDVEDIRAAKAAELVAKREERLKELRSMDV